MKGCALNWKPFLMICYSTHRSIWRDHYPLPVDRLLYSLKKNFLYLFSYLRQLSSTHYTVEYDNDIWKPDYGTSLKFIIKPILKNFIYFFNLASKKLEHLEEIADKLFKESFIHNIYKSNLKLYLVYIITIINEIM